MRETGVGVDQAGDERRVTAYDVEFWMVNICWLRGVPRSKDKIRYILL